MTQATRCVAAHRATAVVFSPDGKSVAIKSNSFGDTLQLFDIDSGTARWKRSAHGGSFSAVSFNADGSLLAVASGGNAKVLDADDGYVVMRCRFPGDGSGTQFSISPDGTSLTAIRGRVVRVYDVWSRDEAFSLREETVSFRLKAACDCLRYSPDGTLIATLGTEATWKPGASIGIYVWDAASFQLQAMWRAPAKTNRIQFGGCSHVLVTAGKDSVIRAWDVASGTLTALCDTAPDTAGSTRLTLGDGSGRVALTSRADGTLRVWDVTTGLERTRLPTSPKFRLGAVNSDATKLATSNGTKSVEIWSLAGGAQQQPAPDAAAPDYWCPRCSAG